MGIDTPAGLTRQFKYPLLAVRTGNMYKLMQDLRRFPEAHTVYPFGEYLHLSLQKPIEIEVIKSRLMLYGHEQVDIFSTDATIEDTFMELMKNETAR